MQERALADGLRRRFRHYDPERCAPYFHPEQPATMTHEVAGQGAFPAALLANSAWWFYDPERRPLTKPDAQGKRAPMKVQVGHKDLRRIIYDTLDPPELLLVEGELHALAACSVGYDGVLVAGGTQTILGRSATAKDHLRRLVEGKAVRILFDADEPGRKAAPKVAQALLQAGAAKVAVVEPPFPAGKDLDQWLAGFDDPRRALGELSQALGRAEWRTAEQVKEGGWDQEVELVQSERLYLPGDPVPVLVVMTWQEATREAGLAVFGPEDLPTEPPEVERTPTSPSVTHDAPEPTQPVGDATHEVGAARGWHLLERWAHGGKVYTPDVSGDQEQVLADHTLVLPPPPSTGPDTSERLWHDLRAFMQQWVAVPTLFYESMVAYALMTWRLDDAGFPYVPYLRFYGPPGSGKGRALDVMRMVCWRSLGAKPRATNLHRTVEYYGDVTMLIDEFHLDRGMSKEHAQDLLDLLNQGHKRSERLIRVDTVRGGGMEVRSFPIFGPKIFAGYGHDEEEAFARRTVSVPMGDVAVSKPMQVFALPPEFYSDAEELRARLLSWRARKLVLGMPSATSDRAVALRDRVGFEVGQTFWPLVEMVPGSMPDELEAVMECASIRKQSTAGARQASDEATMLEELVATYESGHFEEVPGGRFVTMRDVYERLEGRLQGMSVTRLGRELKKLGLRHRRRRVGGRQRAGILLADDESTQRVMQRYGIEWPVEAEQSEAGL